MRNKNTYFIAASLVLAILTSCSKDEVEELTPPTNDPIEDTTLVLPTDSLDSIPNDTLNIEEDTTAVWSETVDTVIVSRYVGLWYEIGSIPQIFQTGCNCTTAEYAAISATEISVINACNLFSPSGFQNRVEGSATIVPNSGNAKLLVSFFGAGGADYWIIDLDPDYGWAVVGAGDKQSFWILSRTPTLDATLYNELLTKWGERGYDVSRVVFTQQNGC